MPRPRRPKTPPIPVRISPAPAAEALARPLIEEHHRHLLEVRLLFLFTNKKRLKHKKTTLGTAQKLSAMLRYLSSGENTAIDEGVDFIILLGELEWAGLTDAQRRALVDHELAHCDGAPNAWRLRGHDVEEFAEVIQRHGLWQNDVARFIEVAGQLTLPNPKGSDREPVGAR